VESAKDEGSNSRSFSTAGAQLQATKRVVFGQGRVAEVGDDHHLKRERGFRL
jgi:hypothetical protein